MGQRHFYWGHGASVKRSATSGASLHPQKGSQLPVSWYPGTPRPAPASPLFLSTTATFSLGVDRGGLGLPAALGQGLSVGLGRVCALPHWGWWWPPHAGLGCAVRASPSPLVRVLLS